MLDRQSITRFGRVTEASIDRFTAECFAKETAPALGELVVVEDEPNPIYAVVAAAVTQGIDPERRVASHGGPDDDLSKVYADHPHVQTLLMTTFQATVAGHQSGGEMRHYLPAAPAPILARVRACSEAETAAFTLSLDYLRMLVNAGPLADEVMAASLRRAAAARPDSRSFLVRAGKALTPLLGRDPMRLQATLRRIQP